MKKTLSFQQLITTLNQFWQKQGCVLIQPLDMEVGAGTFHPATFIRSIGPEPWKCAYVQPSRRPTDGRYGENPNRLQHYYQYQVLIKPSPANLQNLYLQSLETIGIDCKQNDIRFIEDNWESPTLGSWGLGWEVWLNGMEITQFTYFQQTGGLECQPVSGEITYGLERLAMSLQGVNSVYDIVWNYDNESQSTIYYRDVYQQNEVEQSAYNFEFANIDNLKDQFEQCYQTCEFLVAKKLPLPAYEQVMKASHLFNLLDARKAISVTERQRTIFRVRKLSNIVAECYTQRRLELNHPMGNVPFIKPEPVEKTKPQKATGCFLLEIGCEELPADMTEKLALNLKDNFCQQLDTLGFDYKDVKYFSTPRRLALQIKSLQSFQKNNIKTRKGPRVNAPEQAVLGFANSNNVSKKDLSSELFDNVDYWVHTEKIKGQSLFDLIQDILNQVAELLPIKKYMRWGNSPYKFIRPVRWIVALHNKQVIPLQFMGVSSSNRTYGHRFYNSDPLVLKNANEYQTVLDANYVIADFNLRKEIIKKQLNDVSQALKATINHDESLLNEIVSLVEFPTVIVGEFPEKFLQLPKECLITTLQEHQKYFTVTDGNNDLLPFFITVSNLPKSDSPRKYKTIAHGNERVVIPRLEDALFFWQKDRSQSLISYQDQLSKVTFADGLGTVLQKTERLQKLAIAIANNLGYDSQQVDQIAQLTKCDLVTDMVREFPNLQGIVGKYYATADGIDAQVSLGIEEHYLPRSSAGALPRTVAGSIVAIADKIDTIIGFFALKKLPFGSSDPFALRRLGLGIIRILIDQQLSITIKELLHMASANWQEQLNITTPIQDQVEEFLWLRLKAWSTEQNYSVPLFQAVLAVKPSTPYDFILRLSALKQFVELPNSSRLSEANHRIKNILHKSPIQTNAGLNSSLYNTVYETDLANQLLTAITSINNSPLYYFESLNTLSELAKPVEDFFENVMIMDKDLNIRQNRLNLISLIRQQFLMIADISLLQLK